MLGGGKGAVFAGAAFLPGPPPIRSLLLDLELLTVVAVAESERPVIAAGVKPGAAMNATASSEISNLRDMMSSQRPVSTGTVRP